VSVDRGRIDEPVECERCNGKHTFEMVHNRCLYVIFERVSLMNHSNSTKTQTPTQVHKQTNDQTSRNTGEHSRR
jgi:hypothetical protein